MGMYTYAQRKVMPKKDFALPAKRDIVTAICDRCDVMVKFSVEHLDLQVVSPV